MLTHSQSRAGWRQRRPCPTHGTKPTAATSPLLNPSHHLRVIKCLPPLTIVTVLTPLVSHLHLEPVTKTPAN